MPLNVPSSVLYSPFVWHGRRLAEHRAGEDVLVEVALLKTYCWAWEETAAPSGLFSVLSSLGFSTSRGVWLPPASHHTTHNTQHIHNNPPPPPPQTPPPPPPPPGASSQGRRRRGDYLAG